MTRDKGNVFGEAGEGTSARAIVLPQHWMHGRSVAQRALGPMLDANKLTSLSAMIAYAASKSGQSEYRIERALADTFHVANTKFLAASDFDSAIQYLTDIISL